MRGSGAPRTGIVVLAGLLALACLVAVAGVTPAFPAQYSLGTHGAGLVTTAAPALSIASFSFNPSTIQANSSTQVSIQLSGGTPPFYAWLNNTPPGCQQGSVPEVTSNFSNSFSCSPTASGTFTVHLDVMDSAVPASKASRSATLTVNSGSGGGGGGGNGSFSLPSGLLATVTLLALVFLGALVAIAAGTVATAVVLSRRLRQVKEALEKLQKPPESPRPPV